MSDWDNPPSDASFKSKLSLIKSRVKSSKSQSAGSLDTGNEIVRPNGDLSETDHAMNDNALKAGAAEEGLGVEPNLSSSSASRHSEMRDSQTIPQRSTAAISDNFCTRKAVPVVKWACSACNNECVPIVRESRCLCGHRFKDHKPETVASRNSSSNKNENSGANNSATVRFKCSTNKCPCRHFFFLVAEGSWILRCRCKHKHTDHDCSTAPYSCLKCNNSRAGSTGCNGFDSPWVCNCGHSWGAHKQFVVILKDEAAVDREAAAVLLNNPDGNTVPSATTTATGGGGGDGKAAGASKKTFYLRQDGIPLPNS